LTGSRDAKALLEKEQHEKRYCKNCTEHTKNKVRSLEYMKVFLK
jgi:hypothetical protein